MKILLISIAFPPKNDPECLQTARYFKYLNAHETVQQDVVTSKVPTLFMPYDKSLDHYANIDGQKIELPIYESKLTSYVIRKFLPGKLIFPDSKMTFYWQWKKVIRKLKSKPDIIYSRSNPMSSAMMGLRLKEYFRCPWVMHLSDPWSISPLHQFKNYELQKVREVERFLFEKANVITLTSRRTLELYKQQYPEYSHKLNVLPNVYDPDDVDSDEWPNAKKLRIVYTGGMTGQRNALFLYKVLELLQDSEKLLDKIEFIFAGELDRVNRSNFQNGWSCVQHIGKLSFSEVRTLYKSAHILMVIDNPTSTENAIFFPSKILDYFVAKRMIWAITPEHSTTREVLRAYNHVAFSHNEIDSMAAFLKNAISNFQKKNMIFFQVNKVPEDFDAKVNADHLRNIFNKILSSK